MRSHLLPAILFAALAVAPAAFAAATTTTVGTVKEFSGKQHKLVLADGTAFHLHKHYKAHTFKAGEKVKVVWEKKGKTQEASRVWIVK
ncbi:hypothetical protein [Acidimangrovimonas pyrenivorans]|uniref:DUF1344 domain-containing protein n=1 Tax=Acidimangrovimonas pyrenivorans TaxID=2030798 RepID=A0ABV7AK98_9RHOB